MSSQIEGALICPYNAGLCIYGLGAALLLTAFACGGVPSGPTAMPTDVEQQQTATRNLNVTVSGAGSGTVTSSPSGIRCPSNCSASYDTGTEVTLTAAPASGSTFAGWSGDCGGTSQTASVAMESPRSCTATFDVEQQQTATRNLNVTVSGAGSGTVTSSPSGIRCPSNCSASYDTGTEVTLTAAPASGSTFAGWSGDCGGTSQTVSVTMDAARSCTATFDVEQQQTATRNLNVTVSGAGSGTVTSSPSGISCPSNCSASYDTGTEVTLTAAPASGSTFAGWSGDCGGTSQTVSVTMDAARSCTATFDVEQQQTATRNLNVTVSGAGSGTVTSSPSGISCPSNCSASYDTGTEVTLTAAPASGSTFAGWSGDCGGTSQTVSVTMDAARSCTATFDVEQSAGSVGVSYDFRTPIAGFQFGVTGVSVTGAGGGTAEATGFTVSTGNNIVIGFSVTGATISAGQGVLVVLDVSGSGDACLRDLIISDSSGNALSASVEDCLIISVP